MAGRFARQYYRFVLRFYQYFPIQTRSFTTSVIISLALDMFNLNDDPEAEANGEDSEPAPAAALSGARDAAAATTDSPAVATTDSLAAASTDTGDVAASPSDTTTTAAAAAAATDTADTVVAPSGTSGTGATPSDAADIAEATTDTGDTAAAAAITSVSKDAALATTNEVEAETKTSGGVDTSAETYEDVSSCQQRALVILDNVAALARCHSKNEAKIRSNRKEELFRYECLCYMSYH